MNFDWQWIIVVAFIIVGILAIRKLWNKIASKFFGG